jgi:predicted permease
MTQHPYAVGEASLLDDRNVHWLLVLGRLRDGASLAEADAALDTVFGRITAGSPEADAERGARTAAFGPIPAHNRGQSLIGAGAVFALVGLVLLIICGNVAGMALARSATREREIAVRLALGSSRARLVRYLMGEAMVLALVGGGLGVIVAFWGTAVALPTDMAVALALPEGGLHPNPGGLAYAFGLTLATLLAFGLLPALRFSRPELLSSLKDDVGGGGRRVGRVHRLAATAQTGVALLSLVVCSLFVRSLGVMEERDLGFEPSNLMITTMDLSVSGYDDPVEGQLFLDRVRESVAAVPGVTAVSIADGIPLDLVGNFTSVYLELPTEDSSRVGVEFTRASEDFFDAVGTPLLRGRGIERTDDGAAERVVVITRALAERLWPGAEAVGRRLWTRVSRNPAQEHTVIGVVPSVASSRATEDWPHIFLSQRQNFDRRVMVVVRTTTDAGDFVSPVQDAIVGVDRALSTPQIVTSLSLLERSTESHRATASMAGGLGLLALILSAIGVYGVVGFAVANRTREIGLRMAIGATRQGVVREIMRDAVRLAVPGLIVGGLVAVGLSLTMQSMMFGLSPIDPVSFGGSALILFIVVLTASLVPARRASNVDPSEALRAD